MPCFEHNEGRPWKLCRREGEGFGSDDFGGVQKLPTRKEELQERLAAIERGPGPDGEGPITQMPIELLLDVFSRLEAPELCAISQVSREWNVLSKDGRLWRALYLRHSWRSVIPETVVSEVQTKGGWKIEFGKRHLVETSFSHPTRLVTELEGHLGTVTCLQADDNKIISGSDDGTLKMWETRRGKNPAALHSFCGHGGPVWCLQYDEENRLYSGSYDKTIKMWEVDSGKCLKTMRGHDGWVSCLDLQKPNRLVSGSWDATVKVWDTIAGSCAATLRLRQHELDSVYCLQAFEDSVVCGTRGRNTQLWNLEKGELVTSFEGHKKSVYALVQDELNLVTASGDKTVKVWDLRQKACTHNLDGHTGAVLCVGLQENLVFSGSYDRTIRVWDLRTSRCLHAMATHNSSVFCLSVDDRRLITGSADKTVIVHHFRPSSDTEPTAKTTVDPMEALFGINGCDTPLEAAS